MLKNISRILPFFIVTLLSIGIVELFYGVAENYLLPPKSEKTESAIVQDQGTGHADKLEKHTDYDIILQRNLFRSYTPDKEAPPAPVVENPLEGLEPTSLDLVLMGTVSGSAGNSRAVILNRKKNKQDIYYRGDVVEEAEIKEILRGKVILNHQGKDQVLDMSEAASMRPPVAVAPSPERGRILGPQEPSPRRRVIPADLQGRAADPDPDFQEEMNGEPEDFEEEIPEETELDQPDEVDLENGGQQDISEPPEAAEQTDESDGSAAS